MRQSWFLNFQNLDTFHLSNGFKFSAIREVDDPFEDECDDENGASEGSEGTQSCVFSSISNSTENSEVDASSTTSTSETDDSDSEEIDPDDSDWEDCNSSEVDNVEEVVQNWKRAYAADPDSDEEVACNMTKLKIASEKAGCAGLLQRLETHLDKFYSVDFNDDCALENFGRKADRLHRGKAGREERRGKMGKK